MDTKKKELVGDFKNNGHQWHPKGNRETVRVHDFPDPQLGKAIPYGVYDLARNAGWVSVGIDHDTAAFAVNTIRRWWKATGQTAYPKARSLLIMADSGGSNGARVRLWKWELYKQTSTGLTVRCVLDRKRYPTKVTVREEQMAKIRLIPDAFHGDWNYTIRPTGC